MMSMLNRGHLAEIWARLTFNARLLLTHVDRKGGVNLADLADHQHVAARQLLKVGLIRRTPAGYRSLALPEVR
jgi:hypothetical protein